MRLDNISDDSLTTYGFTNIILTDNGVQHGSELFGDYDSVWEQFLVGSVYLQCAEISK